MSISRKLLTAPCENGDGFTAAEVETAMRSPPHNWEPRKQYKSLQICELSPGQQYVTSRGRVVNLYDQQKPSNVPYGCCRVLVRDDTGILLVRLWYARYSYELHLGQLVTVFTTNISNGESTGDGAFSTHDATCVTTLHPERNSNCCFKIEASDDGTLFKRPFDYNGGEQLTGLMTLKSYVEGGHEVADSRVLVCIKSIGGRKTVTTKKGNELDLLNVGIFDDTSDATLSLCGGLTASATPWKTSRTILLLSNPGFRGDKRPVLCINWGSVVDVDPDMKDAEWLRGFAHRMTMKEAVNFSFPEGGMARWTAHTLEFR
ncbi:MAG: hypothetical protein Q9218_000628 [Villophora microphyllina]